jgi:3-oxoacyl-[acyl-carrier-protein] synthase-3
MTRHANIVATGRYLPVRALSNADVARDFGLEVDEGLAQKTGIENRHVLADDERTSDLAIAAARQALERAGVLPSEVDLIIVATDTPDYLSPATAAVVQAGLGARRAGAYDVNAACAGWVTALDIGCKTIVADAAYRHVLVIGAYAMSRFLDWRNARTASLFGDGAGAVLLAPSREPGFRGACLAAEGAFHDALGIYTGGSARPATAQAVADHGQPHVEFVRHFPSAFNTERWPQLVQQTLDRAELAVDDVDLFLFTQINRRTIEGTMAALGLPMSRTHTIMERWGYTGSACLPIALDDAVERGRLAPGQHVLFCASGGGVCMATALFRWTA